MPERFKSVSEMVLVRTVQILILLVGLLLAFMCLMHFCFIFVPQQYYIDTHGGDVDVARSVSAGALAVSLFFLATHYNRLVKVLDALFLDDED